MIHLLEHVVVDEEGHVAVCGVVLEEAEEAAVTSEVVGVVDLTVVVGHQEDEADLAGVEVSTKEEIPIKVAMEEVDTVSKRKVAEDTEVMDRVDKAMDKPKVVEDTAKHQDMAQLLLLLLVVMVLQRLLLEAMDNKLPLQAVSVNQPLLLVVTELKEVMAVKVDTMHPVMVKLVQLVVMDKPQQLREGMDKLDTANLQPRQDMEQHQQLDMERQHQQLLLAMVRLLLVQHPQTHMDKQVDTARRLPVMVKPVVMEAPVVMATSNYKVHHFLL